VEILWNAAWRAFASAFVMMIMSQIALDIVGGIWREMTPKPPPGLIHPESTKLEPDRPAFRVNLPLKAPGFRVLWTLIFLGMAGTRLAAYSQRPRIRDAAAGLVRISRRVSNRWFGAIVGNAFYAWAMMMALYWAQMFSTSQWLLRVLVEVFQPVIQSLAHFFLSAPGAERIGNLYSWYDDNQLKFYFWCFYLAAIADDLGLPNFKTLGRGIWHWLGNRRSF
jgi:hypothetical protein